MRFLSSLLAVSASLFSAFYFQSALAQPAGTVKEDFIYIVEPNDTLSQIADLYTTKPDLWRQIQQLNHVEDDTLLPIGKELRIPHTLIPVIATHADLVHYAGTVFINDRPTSTRAQLKTGDTIRTGKASFATLQLQDQSTLTLPPESQLHIKQLNEFERARLTDAIVELQAGSVESRVAPTNTGVGRFEISTPVSVTGVRGTDLRVHTNATQSRTELLTGKAQLDTSTTQLQPLQKEFGAAVNNNGNIVTVPLLAAPQLSTPEQGRQGWQTTLTPVPDAISYAVYISRTEDGSEPVQRYLTDKEQTVLLLRPSGAGTHYAYVRAIDENGLMGLNAYVAFPGRATLSSSNGTPILSSDGQPIFLSDY